MGYKLYDFECRKCKQVFEAMIDKDKKSVPCEVCTGKADRLVAAPRIDWKKMGLDPGFPSAYDKWAKVQTKFHTTPEK